ncbi:uncharacterized protein BO97DRAFT_437029 [Aspergillus homomorphus CBS 101889]|uniref:AHC1-like C2H2 zinc-finger domain-containing protein n=1 Tax=Aspergillus homomorphus (strain CBS 101889) TaxID=1450537 RepID=A0A395HPJ3_ASPHC|nr:hypothetical protein BO97DRAFT_437029 [Aspergillus homomorphus CBS 101889]RAL09343.1 hypothetical protein BO97DRAFT_437029 [Aspergillus homomorphus CBS 101889]
MLATPPCPAPGVNAISLPQLKRKRSESSNSTPDQDTPVATKLRADNAPRSLTIKQDNTSTMNNTMNNPDTVSLEAPSNLPANSTSEMSQPLPHPLSTVASAPPAVPKDTGSRKLDVDALRETLEAQLSLEVLLKHNELRLIDQEIAKCQVALEQIRRCAEIPYPGSNVAGYSQSVSNGTGMAIWAPENGPVPLSPAPWGTTDGPYTRHYARWLIPDPRFDGGEVEPATPMTGGLASPWTEGRSTRGSCGDLGYVAGKTRPQRGTGGRLQSLPNGYPPPKEKPGPMLIRRKSDNLLVKLVCLDCRRDNFSSTQGFINHCRIAHSRNYASHEAAAVESGEPVEVDEAGAIIGGKNEPSTPATTGFIHPLIRSAHVIEPLPKTAATLVSDANVTPRKRSSPSRQAPSGAVTPTTLATASDASFMASPATPHLSNLMKLRGVAVDLEQLVGDAKTVVDLNDYSDDDEGESDAGPVQPSAEMSQDQTPLGVRAGRQPMRTTASQAATRRPGSRKGLDSLDHRPPPLQTSTPTRATPYQSPYPSMSCLPPDSQTGILRELEGTEQASNLSPNTAESNQAPSLVSDDDDYGEGSDSDPGPSSSEAGDHDEDLGHIDVEDGDENTTRSATATPAKSDIGMATTSYPSVHEYTTMSTPIKTYDPNHITKETFQSLLSRYPSTVESVTRRKALEKRKASSKKKSNSNPKPTSKSTSASTTTTTTEDPDASSAASQLVQTYLTLDNARYTTLPATVRSRATAAQGPGYLEKEELERLVEWKMKHGKFRPALLGMIRSNAEDTVRDATAKAFRLLHSQTVGIFPRLQEALESLTRPLRGVGPATGSLVLSVLRVGVDGDADAGADDVPFYSDDVYLWLCFGVFPGCEGPDKKMNRALKAGKSGELDVKYNVAEYRELWDAVVRLRERLGVGCAEIEMVGFVLRNGVDFMVEDQGESKKEEVKEQEGEEDENKNREGQRKRPRGKNENVEEKVGVRRSTRQRRG